VGNCKPIHNRKDTGTQISVHEMSHTGKATIEYWPVMTSSDPFSLATNVTQLQLIVMKSAIRISGWLSVHTTILKHHVNTSNLQRAIPACVPGLSSIFWTANQNTANGWTQSMTSNLATPNLPLFSMFTQRFKISDALPGQGYAYCCSNKMKSQR
jgi:hypothetical protein